MVPFLGDGKSNPPPIEGAGAGKSSSDGTTDPEEASSLARLSNAGCFAMAIQDSRSSETSSVPSNLPSSSIPLMVSTGNGPKTRPVYRLMNRETSGPEPMVGTEPPPEALGVVRPAGAPSKVPEPLGEAAGDACCCSPAGSTTPPSAETPSPMMVRPLARVGSSTGGITLNEERHFGHFIVMP